MLFRSVMPGARIASGTARRAVRYPGATVFFLADSWPLGVLFIGLALVYVAEFFASFKIGVRVGLDGQESTNLGEKALGAIHILVGLWLMYLTFATTLNIASGFDLPAA